MRSSPQVSPGTEPMSAEDWKKFLANATVRRFNTGDVALEDDTENKSLFMYVLMYFYVFQSVIVSAAWPARQPRLFLRY